MGRIGPIKRVYLAGPGVFLPDPTGYGARKKAICARYGLEGVFPLDSALDLGDISPFEQGCRISLANEALIRGADCLIADMTPYHGLSMDVGTAFEMGFARALGMPVLGYANIAASFIERARAAFGARIGTDPLGRPEIDGMALEDFGMIDNLMLHGAVHQSGFAVIAEDVGEAERHSALGVFEKLVALIAP